MANPSSNRAHLMLRYHAPFHDFKRHVERLLPICRQANIGEVVFLNDAEEYFFGFPTLTRQRLWAGKFKRAGEELRKHGILMSINPWVTLGHSGRGYPPPKRLGLTMMVGDDGAVASDTACPADPAWQKYIAESYAILASANPGILWLEDDHRLHNHCDVRFGSFAKPMLAEFAKRTGQLWNREALVKAIVTGNGAAREQWLKFTGDLWNENITRIREAVHRVNPNVKLAQMTSGMGMHSVEGRRWAEFLAAQAGLHQPITRPHFGPYRQCTGFDFAVGLALFRHGLAFAKRTTRCCPELDNGPHSYFSKSRQQTKLMLELCQFFGCRDVTFNFFALAGNDPRNEPWVVQQLNEARPRLDALAALGLERRIEHGVHVWTDEHAALYQKTDGQPVEMSSLQPAFDSWGRVFVRGGVASTFETRGPLTAVSGDTIRAADDAEVRRLLGGGLLLDGRAAAALQDMGYGRYLGVRVGKRQVSGEAYSIPIERVRDFRFGLKGSPVMGLTQLGHNWGDCYIYLNELAGAGKISELESADHRPIAPGVTLFENALGGRVAVYPFDFDSGIADSVRFYHHPRKCQLQAVLRWLNRGRSILACPDMAMVAVEDNTEALAVINLGGDALDGFTLDLRAPVSRLDERGRWQRAHPGRRALFRISLQPFEACYLRWESSR